MNVEIKNLELIGQNSSLKQHGNLVEMLADLGIAKDSIKSIQKKEFVCALVPDDDDDSEA